MNKKDMKTLANKVIVITGASSGIGEAMAKVYAAQGAKVVLGARNVQKLQLLAGDIRARGGQAAYCGVDVTKPEECRELIETAVREFGGIDVLICNAGISMRAIFDDVDLGVLHRLMDVNFWGTVNCCKFALPYLQASKGSVVGISSVAGLHGLPGRTGYSASKYAMTGFLETLRIENLKKGLHVMIACPGFTASNVRFSALTADGKQQGATPRNESKMMTPEEVARIVAKGILRRKRLCLMESEGSLKLHLKDLKIHRSKFRQIIQVGLPAGMQGAVFSISNVLIQSSVNSFGSVAMAGNTTSQNIEGFIYNAMNAVYQANLSFTSQNFGGKKYSRINRIMFTCLGVVTAVGLGMGIPAYLCGHALIRIYSSDPEVMVYGMRRLVVFGTTYFLCGIMDTMVGSIRGLGYSVMPMCVSLLGACGLRIVWIFTVFQVYHNLTVLYLSYPFTWIVTATAHMICFYIVRRKLPREDA